jgi:hypothetical protein
MIENILILPLKSSLEVIENMKKNPNCIISKIDTIMENNIIKQKIKYNYDCNNG